MSHRFVGKTAKESLYELDLFESLSDYSKTFIRVPGGWVFKARTMKGNISTCFVPYNEEFKEAKNG